MQSISSGYSRLTRPFTVFAFALALLACCAMQLAHAQPAGWAYSAPIRVSPATPVADYQVQLDLTPATFNYSLAKADGSDLRVYVGGTALSYWIEKWNPAGVSTVWVKVPSAGTSALWLYYGNAAATVVSSGADTFDLFDDFNSLDAWTPALLSGGSASITTADGATVARLSSPGAIAITRPFASSNAGYVIETRTMVTSLGDGFMVAFTDGALAQVDLPSNGYIFAAFRQFNTQDELISYGANPVLIAPSHPASALANQWYVAGISWVGDAVTAIRNGETVMSGSNSTFSSFSHIQLSNLASTWNFDWVRVRKLSTVTSVATLDGPLIYTASHLVHAVTAHGRSADGDTVPLKIYGGGASGIHYPTCSFVDGDELFVANHHIFTVSVHSTLEPGTAAPKRTIAGGLTGLNYPTHCWVDNGELFIANAYGGNVTVFNTTDSGNVAPKRVLTVHARGVAVAGDELIVPDEFGTTIRIFAKTASDPAPPVRMIAGANTQLTSLIGVHAARGELFAISGNTVRVFNVSDDGNVAPKRSIMGPLTRLVNPAAAWVVFDEIFVADYGTPPNGILVFNVNDDGDVAPKRVIAGGSTSISYPYHVATVVIVPSLLTVAREGTGGGSVTSADSSIQCGATCAHLYPNGALITLTASADAGSQFTGWLGACTDTGPCQITIGADTTVSATFAPSALSPFVADVDLNHAYEAAFDGVLVLRYLFGFTGTSLTDNALGSGPGRTEPAQIASYLNNIRPLLDFDGNGRTDALTDGALLMRYLLGLRDDALIAGLLGVGATRTLAADVQTAIHALLP